MILFYGFSLITENFNYRGKKVKQLKILKRKLSRQKKCGNKRLHWALSASTSYMVIDLILEFKKDKFETDLKFNILMPNSIVATKNILTEFQLSLSVVSLVKVILKHLPSYVDTISV